MNKSKISWFFFDVAVRFARKSNDVDAKDCSSTAWIVRTRMERALRVIPRGNHGWRFTARNKSCNNLVQKTSGFLIRKMAIAQNLCVQLTLDQFSFLDYVKTYPEMHPLCRIYFLGESSEHGKIFGDTEKVEIFTKSWLFSKTPRKLPESF